MQVKMGLLTGRVATVQVPEGATVVDVARAAAEAVPSVDWPAMVQYAAGGQQREVRVGGKKLSNVREVPDGYAGSVYTTPLKDGDVVMMVGKIQGNLPNFPAPLCQVNGVEFLFESMSDVNGVLTNVVGLEHLEQLEVRVNGEAAPATQLVCNGDVIQVQSKRAVRLAKEAADLNTRLAASIEGRK